MQPLKILHTADWHLGNFPCPASKDKQNLRFLDICAYIEYLITEANNQQPDLIIIAGDIFHQAKTWSDRGLQETETIIKYIDELGKIAPTYVLRGTPNHDGKTHFSLLSTALANRDNIFIIDEACVKIADNKAAIAFVPIFDKNTFRAGSDETLDKEAENNFFSAKVRDAILDLKREADKYDLPTILVTHYTVLGAALPNNKTSIFANNDVVIDPVTLIQSDYWLTCLGHIHKPQQLESCPSAFYSGSLCALNFNDEQDPHGFYIHTINNKNDIQSEFIETPSRKFKTFFFNDNDLTTIISRDYNLTGIVDNSFAGYIIRVIYSCMDTTNKALNKAAFEKALYSFTEAFYIQEITPAEIAVSVDKTAMHNNTGILDNLANYLNNEKVLHGSISDAQIQSCLELAQPLIDEISANQTANHSVGVFTPIEIEVKNYRNYKHAVFNYDDIHFCVINGDNGAGKSSLFMDAMIDALFEEPREGEISGWINNDANIRSGSIKLTFAIGDNVYKVTRTRQKSGKATLNIAQLMIDENDEEVWVDMSEDKIRDTQAVINKIVGMDVLTLKSCGLIMQDGYGLFLQADKAVRMDILSTILGLGIYNELNNAVSEYSLLCKQEINKITNEEDNILATIVDGEKTQKELDEACRNEAQYEEDVQKCGEDLINRMHQREAFTKTIEDHNRLCDEINELMVKKDEILKSIEEQNTIITDANNVIAKKDTLEALTHRYDTLAEIIRVLTEKSNQVAMLMTIRQNLESDLENCDNTATDADRKIAVIQKEINFLECELNGAQDLENNKARWSAAKAKLAENEFKLKFIDEHEKELNELQNKLMETKHALSTATVEYRTRSMELDKKIALLETSGCPITDTAPCRFLADARQAVTEKQEADKVFAAAQAEYDKIAPALETQINETEQLIRDARTNLTDLDTIKREIAAYENLALEAAKLPEKQKTYESYKQQLKDFTEIKANNEAKRTDTINKINENTQQVSALTKETADLDNYKRELASIGDLNILRDSIRTSEINKTNAEHRIEELTKEKQKIILDVYNKIQTRDSLKVDPIEIERIDAAILACKTQQELLNKNIAENSKLIGQLDRDMKKYQDDIRRLDKLRLLKTKTAGTASDADWLKKAFSRNGIPHNIIRSVIPILETTATNILNQMSNNTMSIILKTEKTLTTKKEVATLDVIVRDTATGDLPYLSRSGGERVKAALSVILALAEIKSSESGTQLGFLFIDEPPFLDSNGIEAYCDALVAIQNRYSDLKIMAITHDPEMKSRYPQNIEIVRTANGSEIRSDI